MVASRDPRDRAVGFSIPIPLSLLPLYLLLINGNPLEDISVLTKPAENLALILKDCKIHKNTIQ